MWRDVDNYLLLDHCFNTNVSVVIKKLDTVLVPAKCEQTAYINSICRIEIEIYYLLDRIVCFIPKVI